MRVGGRLWVVSALVAVCCACATSQQRSDPKGPFDAVLASDDAESEEARRAYFEARRDLVRGFLDTGNILRAAESSRRLARSLAGTELADFALQGQAQWEQFLGNDRAALEAFPPREPLNTDPVPERFDRYRPVDAVTAIVEAAVDERAVFLNEFHHMTQHRALTLRLLPELRRLGFTHFAAEALNHDLSHDDPELADRGYPIHGKTGWYVHEALLGHVVRTALDLGFAVVPYEFPGAPDVREEGQARRLFEATLGADPDARIFVHSGMAHNRRDAEAFDGVGSMLWHFERMSGVRAFSIDQTMMTERARAEEEAPIYRHATESHSFREPVVFAEGFAEVVAEETGPLFTTEEFDAVVFSPRVRRIDGRPHWLRVRGRRDVAIPEGLCAGASPCLVEARFAHETGRPAKMAIPIDRIEITTSDAQRPVLVLPKGRFRVRGVDASGRVVSELDLPVD